MRKKQEVNFIGYAQTMGRFITPSLEFAVMNSSIDPAPVNRKSRRAMFKIIQGMKNDTKQGDPKTDRLQKKKRKEGRKASRLSRRLAYQRAKAA